MWPRLVLARIATAVLLCAALCHQSSAQETIVGVTWSPPEDEQAALSDLYQMWTDGIRAVRTSPIRHASLFAAGDTLGMAFFQEINVGSYPAGRLRDSTDYARKELRSILDSSRRFRSARHIGLARAADTSDPDACKYFEVLSEEIERSGLPVVSYYTTRFIGSDLCGHTVDGVLLETRDADISTLKTIAEEIVTSGPRVLGFASVGTWVDLDLANRGVTNLHSPEWQARYLEDALGILLGPGRQRSEYVFVHRWRDPIGQRDEYADILQRRYGLRNSSDGPRPALQVVSGFATGRQAVFAFDRGVDSGTRWIWMSIGGWIALGLLALVYATSPQMRHMVPRYFLSHGFYREAVASGRESLPAETIALLVCVSAGVGMLLCVFLYEISLTPVFEAGRAWISADTRDFVGALLDQPWTLTAVLGSLYALTIVAWTSTMSFISRAGSTLLPAQMLMLVVWSQWPLLVLLLVAPAIATSDPGSRLQLSGVISVLMLLAVTVSVVRTLMDFFSISRPKIAWLILGIALHPLLVATIVGTFAALGRYSGEWAYVIHLLTRS